VSSRSYPLDPARRRKRGSLSPGKRTTVAFQNGKPVGCTVVPMGEAFTIIGGDRADTTAWFIVVRRDKPGA
jgi:hypothetical protein